jgi:hypothetical protein
LIDETMPVIVIAPYEHNARDRRDGASSLFVACRWRSWPWRLCVCSDEMAQARQPRHGARLWTKQMADWKTSALTLSQNRPDWGGIRGPRFTISLKRSTANL